MNKEEFIERIKEINTNVPNEYFFLEYNKVIYKILDENEKLEQEIQQLKEDYNILVSDNCYVLELEKKIDKAIKYIEDWLFDVGGNGAEMSYEDIDDLLEILKGDRK